VFLCVGVYLGILVIAALAQSRGIPPLRVGSWLARARDHRPGRRERITCSFTRALFWQERLSKRLELKDGGWSVFGAFLAMVPVPSRSRA
jgi:hypothetical protein